MKPDQAGQAWLDALPDPTIVIDGSARLEWANRAAARLFGYQPDDYAGRSVLDLIHPDDLQFALLSLSTVQSKDVGTLIEVRVQTATGWRLVELVGANHLESPGVGCLLMTMRDLTERRRWEVGRNDDSVFRAVVHNAASLLMLVGQDGCVRAVSGAISRLLGRDPESLEGVALLALVSEADRPVIEAAMAGAAMAGAAMAGAGPQTAGRREPITVEAGLLDGSGAEVPFELTFVGLAGDPTVDGVVVSAHNITKLRAFQKALTDMARTDPLTLLPNRSVVDERLEQVLSARTPVAVAFVDLDDFKPLNDRFGHHFGDQVLKAVAARLSSTVRPTDLVARYGGDEFVVVAEELAACGGLDRRLTEAMSQPVRVNDREVLIKASVGVTSTRPNDTVTEVLIRADRAMYGLKSGRTSLGAVPG